MKRTPPQSNKQKGKGTAATSVRRTQTWRTQAWRTPAWRVQLRRTAIPTALAAVAVLLRLHFVFSLRDTPFFLQHFSDSRLYMQLAEQILGEGIPHAYFMSPLYPHLVALVWKITGNPELWVRILQAFSGGGVALLTYLLGRKLFDSSTALLAALVTALYAPLIFHDGLLLTESLHTLLVLAHLAVLVSAFRRRNNGYWIAAGILLGLVVITRSTAIVFLPTLIVIWLFMRGEGRPQLRHVLAYAAAALLTLVPTAWHNAATEGVFQPVTSSFGYNLYAGNNAEAMGLYKMPENVDLYTDVNGRHWAERQTGRSMNAAEVSAFWRDRALLWMGAHPSDAAALLLRKVVLFFHPGEIDQLGLSIRFYTEEFGPIIGIPASVFPVLLILAATGLALALRFRQGGWVLPVFALVYVLSTAVFFVSARLRLPLMPILILYGAYALVTFVKQTKDGKHRALLLPTALGAAVALGLLLLQPEVHQGFEQEQIKLGKVAFGEGSYGEAERRFRASLQEQVTVDGLVNLGNALAAQHRADEAAAQYRAAIQRDSTYALAWFNFGNLRMQTGSAQYAYGYWKKAVECDPRLAEARRNLGLLLMQAGRLTEAREQLRIYLELERDAERRAEIVRDLERVDQLLESGGK